MRSIADQEAGSGGGACWLSAATHSLPSMLRRTSRRPVRRAAESSCTKSGGGVLAAGMLRPADSTTAEMSCQTASIRVDNPAIAAASSVPRSPAGPGSSAANRAASSRMRSRSGGGSPAMFSGPVPALVRTVLAATTGLAGGTVLTSRTGQADPELHRDRGEQLPGLIGVHRPDPPEQLSTSISRLLTLAVQHIGRVRAASCPQLGRGDAGRSGHPGQSCGRAVDLGVDPGAAHLVPAGDLAPAPFAQSGPAGGLASG